MPMTGWNGEPMTEAQEKEYRETFQPKIGFWGLVLTILVGIGFMLLVALGGAWNDRPGI
jgi:hypothetical protein